MKRIKPSKNQKAYLQEIPEWLKERNSVRRKPVRNSSSLNVKLNLIRLLLNKKRKVKIEKTVVVQG
jgi:hypothetical protein